jgi:hypothetical protein
MSSKRIWSIWRQPRDNNKEMTTKKHQLRNINKEMTTKRHQQRDINNRRQEELKEAKDLIESPRGLIETSEAPYPMIFLQLLI